MKRTRLHILALLVYIPASMATVAAVMTGWPDWLFAVLLVVTLLSAIILVLEQQRRMRRLARP